ncbi:serine protease [Burkholderia sp. AU31624]|uniref:S1 family peptidase n=1 Tax=Burkholderia sp. AU31624 TaxID=2879629 RepID=UPI001CF376FE|nr:serine protease [Burkholderia sp. AU31624]MCA8254808.1 serine protease [Burkholderia sp. AU31624]
MRLLSRCAAILITLLAALPSLSEAQALNPAFLRSTVLIAYQKGPSSFSFGSGFFIFRSTKGDGGQVLLITNKHVLPPEGAATSIQVRVTVADGGTATVQGVEIPVVGSDGKYLPTVRLHPNPGFDVAAVNVTEAIVTHHIQGAWIPEGLLSTPERLKNENITVGDEIYLLGYPNAIFDARNISPILRTGVIATVPSEGYAFNDSLRQQFGLPDRIDGFLIDANVYPGSSGSVVILKQQAAAVGSQAAMVLSRAKKTPYILGIVADSIPITDHALGSTQRMGLGVVYSSEAIRTVVDSFPK